MIAWLLARLVDYRLRRNERRRIKAWRKDRLVLAVANRRFR